MISIECYQGIPLDYESFLIMRYDSFFTNCRYFEVYYQDYGINHMLVSKDSTLIELLVFGIKDETAYSFNSLVNIDQGVISEFSKKSI